MDIFTPTGLSASRSRLRGGQRNKSGIALIIVLSSLVLITVLVLALLSSVLTERTNVQAAANTTSARQLAQSVVQLVEGTITQATVPSLTETTPAIAWACQPGMIRTYGTGTSGNYSASSTPLAYYKLYSSNNMVVNANSTPSISTYAVDSDISSTWNSQPDVYVDLNAPIYDSSGTLDFPIVDPRAAVTKANGGIAVEGFGYSNTTTGGTTVPGVALATAATPLLPMPVQWIYVLKDGTYSSPSTTLSTATTASFSGSVNAPTATNPIVGRIAFWTDDECAKVNLNTASEGTYWDTPIAVTGTWTDTGSYTTGVDPTGQTKALGDVTYATLIPGQDEFQRYPGHPAMTCLSTVFGSLFTGTPGRNTVVSNIDAVTPRISDSGTGGTSTLGATTLATAVIQPNFNRLYSSVDDFNFGTSARTPGQTINGTSIQTIVQQSRFFLTTASKAPDLNPFGLPKVTIWPVWDYADNSRRTTLDNAMVHCSTMANGAAPKSQHCMIFTRRDPTSTTVDWNLATDANGSASPRNQQLYEYLETLAGRALPGFGGNLSSATKYGTKVNGTTDIDQILAEIYDYIRCSNLADKSGGAAGESFTPVPSLPSPQGNVAALGQVVPIQISGTNSGGTPRGMGRIETISELALTLVKVDDRKSVTTADTSSNLATTVNVTTHDTNSPAVASFSPASQTCLEWTLIPKMFCGMAGYPALGNDIKIAFSNFTLQIGGVAVQAPSDAPNIYDTGRLGSSTRDSLIGGSIGYYDLVLQAGSSHSETNPPKDSMYPTGLVVIPGQSAAVTGGAAGSATTTISGGCTVTITSPNASGSTVQTFNFSFPSTTVPIPELAYTGGTTWAGTWRGGTYTQGTTASFSYPAAVTGGVAAENTTSRLSPSVNGGYNPYTIFTATSTPTQPNTDVARSLVATGTMTATPSPIALNGDMRLVSLMSAPDSSAFAVDWTTNGTGTTAMAVPQTTFVATSLNHGVLFAGPGMATATLVPGTNWKSYGSNGFQPAVPVLPSTTTVLPQMTATGDGNSPPDWDNGPGLLMDGPYFNKVDEGQGYNNSNSFNNIVYIDDYDATTHFTVQGSNFFDPNRQISSPVMFGSLPVGLDHPWRTLLFRPASLPGYQEAAGGTYTHPGFGDGTAPDHALLDFFRMPIVEPYCISEPLATSGKVNLNTQIVPFTYIQRTTGLRAVLKSVMITAVPHSLIGKYKGSYCNSTDTSINASAAQQSATTRYAIDLTDTINQLTNLNDSTTTNNFPEFSRPTYTALNPNFFVSPSQICDVPLIPLSATGTQAYNNGSGSNLGTFWQNNLLTGDNSIERPYSYIYPRVTTQSNTFTVHVRAQSLLKVPSSIEAATTWTDGTDQVTGEYRGSFTIEKYYDPTNAAIYSPSTSTTADIGDSNDATIPSDSRVVASITTVNGATTVQPILWRLLTEKRFGQ